MPARLALVVALGALGGCGRGALLDPAGATAGASGAGDGAAGVAEATAMPPLPCTPGHDETCNDDPTISSFWGTCEESGQCSCFDGRSVNPATGRCRLGDLCTASAHDPWPVNARFDTSDCAQRPATECTPQIISGSKDPRDVLGGLAMSKCHFPANTVLRVQLVSGCPTVLQSGYDPSQDQRVGGPDVVACLETLLSTLRLACGSGEDCVFFEIPSGIIP